MTKVSTQIEKYIFRYESNEYIINNYDYFTTEYKIPNNTPYRLLDEYAKPLDLVKKMDKSKVVIDVGGNCGIFSIPIEKNGYSVYTFEPVKVNVELLELNKAQNNSHNLHIVPNALSNKIEKRTIYVPYCPDNTSFNQEVAVSNMNKKDYIEEEVETITFDSWIENHNSLNVGFIKIDVQGFEKEVLDGMKKFLKNCDDVYIFIEWDKKHTENAGFSLEMIEEILYSNRFTFVDQIYGDRLFYKNLTK